MDYDFNPLGDQQRAVLSDQYRKTKAAETELARLRAENERWRASNNQLREGMEAQALRANTAELDLAAAQSLQKIAEVSYESACANMKACAAENEGLKKDRERLAYMLRTFTDYFEIHTMDSGRTIRGEQVYQQAREAIAAIDCNKREG